jgi:hypothetical protein
VATAAGTAMAVQRGALLAAATGVAVALAVAVARGAALLAAATGVAVAVAVARAGAASPATSTGGISIFFKELSDTTCIRSHPTRTSLVKIVKSRYMMDCGSLISARFRGGSYMSKRTLHVELMRTFPHLRSGCLVLGSQAPVGAIEEGALFACTTGGDSAGVA